MHGGRESVYKEGKAPHGWRAPHGGRESVYKEGPAWGSLRAVCALLQSFDFAHSRTAWGALQGTTNKAPQGGRESVCKEGTAWGALLRFRRGAPLPLCPPFTHTHTHTHTSRAPLPDGGAVVVCVAPAGWEESQPVCKGLGRPVCVAPAGLCTPPPPHTHRPTGRRPCGGAPKVRSACGAYGRSIWVAHGRARGHTPSPSAVPSVAVGAPGMEPRA